MRGAPARAAPGGRRGSFAGDLLNVESLPPQEVLVNIYESEGPSKQPALRSRLNLQAILASASHVGVEVYRREFGYAFAEEEISGISECVPRRRSDLVYRMTLEMGRCLLMEHQVLEILEDMALTWRGPEFNAVHNNSLDFADELLQQLGLGRLPRELGDSGPSSPSYMPSCNGRIWKPLEQTCSIDFSFSGLFKGATEMGYSVLAMLSQPFSQDPSGDDHEMQADRQLFCQSVACTDDDAGLLATEPATTSLDLEFFGSEPEPLMDSSDVLYELEITVARGAAQERELGCLLSARDPGKVQGSQAKQGGGVPSPRRERCVHGAGTPPWTGRWCHRPSVGTWRVIPSRKPQPRPAMTQRAATCGDLEHGTSEIGGLSQAPATSADP